MNKRKAINDLIGLNYEQGLHTGRWEDENAMDSSADEYLENMMIFADENDVEYGKDLSEYIDYKDEPIYYAKDKLGYEIKEKVEKKLVEIIDDDLIKTQNLINGNMVEQEIATLETILEDYKNKNYNNMFVLIMNYLGHVEHYCSHSGLVYKLLNLFTYCLEKEAKGESVKEDDKFVRFVEKRIAHVKEDF